MLSSIYIYTYIFIYINRAAGVTVTVIQICAIICLKKMYLFSLNFMSNRDKSVKTCLLKNYLYVCYKKINLFYLL